MIPKDKQEAEKNDYPSFSFLEETLNELPSIVDSSEKETDNDLNVDMGNILSDDKEEDKEEEKEEEEKEKEEKIPAIEKIIPVDV